MTLSPPSTPFNFNYKREFPEGVKISEDYNWYDTFNFVSDYFNSPGFNERFKNLNKVFPKGKYITRRKTKPFKSLNIDSPLKEDPMNSYYDSENNLIYFPKGKMNQTDTNTNFSRLNILAHELGHVIDNSIKIDNGVRYSYMYPIFRQSKSYLYAKDLLKNKETSNDEILADFRRIIKDKRNHNNDDVKEAIKMWNTYSAEDYEKDPSKYYFFFHDGDPGESYADLIAFREDLYRSDIYDSRQANNPFTIDHLKKWKSLKHYSRLFENFTDNQIIQMMNTVAQNNSQIDDQPLYAKKGIKLLNKIFK